MGGEVGRGGEEELGLAVGGGCARERLEGCGGDVEGSFGERRMSRIELAVWVRLGWV